jgi:hypothetical protein
MNEIYHVVNMYYLTSSRNRCNAFVLVRQTLQSNAIDQFSTSGFQQVLGSQKFSKILTQIMA